jgi:hypothetical protein
MLALPGLPAGGRGWLLGSGRGRGRLLATGRVLALGLAFAGCGLLAACGRMAPWHATAAPAASAESSDTQGDSPADPTAGMVSAVAPDASKAPLSVKFRLDSKPVLGMPLHIAVAIIPTGDTQINHLHGSFLPDNGLALQSEHEFDASDLQGGVAVQQQVTVVPQQPGVLNLNATLTIQLENSSLSGTYSIPLIVSDNSS